MTLGSHQRVVGKNDNRFTPRWMLNALGEFDADMATADIRPWDIAPLNFTPRENSLTIDWRNVRGRKFLNPPFNRFGVGLFVDRMCEANHGTLLLHARTETQVCQPALATATAVLFVAGRVIFCNPDGTPCIIENPEAKHYGKVANSGAPVMLLAFGFDDADILASVTDEPQWDGRNLIRPPGRIPGRFVPLILPRSVLVELFDQAPGSKSWRAIVSEWLASFDGPVTCAQLYRIAETHPKVTGNPNWRAKLRQTLQRGAGRRVARDQWVPA